MAHMAKNEEGVLYLSDPWYVEDVLLARPDLDEDQALKVLEAVANSFDANLGINWDSLEGWAEYLYPAKKIDDRKKEGG